MIDRAIRVTTHIDVPIDHLEIITTYDDCAVLGWVDQHGDAHGGSITLTQAAMLLFPDEEEAR
jgi:hypothetical protein